ncbi:MAG: serine hydrolase, partial [Marinilabiliales bacterium]
MKTTELYPFKELIKTGVGGIMVAHLYIPALDTTENLASTLSPKIVTDLLKKDMQFKGLVFTDALNMKGVTKYWKEGEVDVKALLAGNDVLLFSQDVPKAIDAIKKAVKAGEISKSTINRRCKKILKAKSWVGLNNYKPVKLENILSDLNSGQAKLVNRNLTEKAITLLKNENDIIPLKRINNYKTVSIAINKGENDIFQNTLNLYKENDLIAIPGNVPKARFESLQDICGKYDLAIVSIYSNQRSPANNYGIPDNVFDFIDSLSSKTNVILSVFASPYILKRFRNIDKIKSIVIAYEDNPVCQHITAQIIYGGVGASGRSPVTISDEFPLGAGMDSQGGIRLRYSIPEKVGIDHSCLFSIDSIVEDAIKEKAFPGCQLLIARKGIVFYNKAYG